MTGIELAGDSCVIVQVDRSREPPRLEAVHVVEPSEWPPRRLARVRRKGHFSARAVVVSWTNDEGALRPLLDAGFTFESVIAPEQALGLLAAERIRSDSGAATAWLAISRQGAAIVIVRATERLYSKRIAWRYTKPTRLNEQLLQRYTLVSHIAPELEHAIKTVREKHGVTVDSAVTCGDLPDLRSLTMPLIEELDLEVETLDMLEGVDVAPAAIAGRAHEFASALHLARVATVLAPLPEPRRRWWGRAAAFAVIVVTASSWWTLRAPGPGRRDVEGRVVTPMPTATAGSQSFEEPVVPLIPQPSVPVRVTGTSASERLPAVSSILFGRNRRLAILNGRIVTEGDTVGSREVLRIEREAVVLRDGSGKQIRVAVRPMKQASLP